MRSVPLGVDTCEVLVPAGHPLATPDTLRTADLAGRRWVCQPPGTVCHDWLHTTLRAAGQEPDVAYYVAEFQTQVALVAAGLGIALLPRLGRGPLPDGVVLRPLEPTPTRRLFAVTRATGCCVARRSGWRCASCARRRAPFPPPRAANATDRVVWTRSKSDVTADSGAEAAMPAVLNRCECTSPDVPPTGAEQTREEERTAR